MPAAQAFAGWRQGQRNPQGFRGGRWQGCDLVDEGRTTGVGIRARSAEAASAQPKSVSQPLEFLIGKAAVVRAMGLAMLDKPCKGL